MPQFKWGWFAFFLSMTFFGAHQRAYAVANIPVAGVLNNIPGLLSGEVATSVVRTFGFVFDHRPMEPASPLGMFIGLDVGIEVDLVQLGGNDLTNTLSARGISIPSIPILPSAKIANIHKGILNNLDFGFSILTYQGYQIWGADIKYVIVNGEEGATWALRLGYNNLHIPVGTVDFGAANLSIAFNTTTWTPVLLVSKKLEFAEPYMGAGVQFAEGEIELNINTGKADPNLNSVTGSTGAFLAFLGLSLKPPKIGFRLNLEGGYNSAGFNYMGTKIGFSF